MSSGSVTAEPHNLFLGVSLKHETAVYLPVSVRQHHEVHLICHAMGVMDSTPGKGAGLAQESEGGRWWLSELS